MLSKEKCTGDPAKRTGNEYMFQELATANIEDLKAAGPKKILTSCPHCVKTIGDDYRRVRLRGRDRALGGVRRGADARRARRTPARRRRVTFHDPCYLGRYAGKVDEPRALLTRFGGDVSEPVRNRENPFCCGAGGGLMFNDKEEEPGTRISDVRFKQLQDTGADTVVTACPFCSIMLKGASASAGAAGEQRAVRRPDDVRERQTDEGSGVTGRRVEPLNCMSADWRARVEAARRPRAISAVGYRAIAALGATLRWRTEGLEHFDAIARRGRQPIMAFWHGRILPATYYFRRRGIVVITSENFDGEWIAGIIERFGYGTARGSTSRGARKALLQLTRDMAAGKAGGVHGRRPARPGARRAARRRVARQGHRQPGAAVSPRGDRYWTVDSWDRDADPEAVRDRRDRDRRAVRRRPRCRRCGDRSGAAGLEARLQRSKRARERCWIARS